MLYELILINEIEQRAKIIFLSVQLSALQSSVFIIKIIHKNEDTPVCNIKQQNQLFVPEEMVPEA